MQEKIEKLLTLTRSEEGRWEGLIRLKSLKSKQALAYLWHFIHDSDWIIRCTSIDKIADLGQATDAPRLLDKLLDPDAMVRFTTREAIKRLTKTDIKPLFKALKHQNFVIREFCVSLIKTRVKSHLSQIVTGISTESWIPANRLLYILWKRLHVVSEQLLIDALSVKNTQRHAIMMLAFLQSRRAITHFVSLYSVPSLRRHIVQAILEMDPDIVFPDLLDYAKTDTASESIARIVSKIGPPILPFIIDKLDENTLAPYLVPLLKEFDLSEQELAVIQQKVANKTLVQKYLGLTG